MMIHSNFWVGAQTLSKKRRSVAIYASGYWKPSIPTSISAVKQRSRTQMFRSVGKRSASSWVVSRIIFLGIIAIRNDCFRNSWTELMLRGVVGIGLFLPAMIYH